MSFSTERDNQASEKFYLIRLECHRHINSFMTSIGGGLYTMTAPSLFGKIKDGTSDYTEVSVTPTGAREYLWDKDTNIVTLYPNDYNNDLIIMEYYLFYTDTKYRVAKADLQSGTTMNDYNAEYLPKLKSYPQLSQGVKNIIAGKLTIDASSMTLINDNYSFNAYLTKYDSFYQKGIKIWECIDNVDNFQIVYTGRIASISNINASTVRIRFESEITKLYDTCTLGHDYEYLYWTTDNYSNMDKNKVGQIIRTFFGTATRYKLRDITVTNLTDAKEVIPQSLESGVCTDTSAVGGYKNRVWGLGVVKSFTDNRGVISYVDNSDPNFTIIRVANSTYIRKGDSVIVRNRGTSLAYKVDNSNPSYNEIAMEKLGTAAVNDFVNKDGAGTGTNYAPVVIITDLAGNEFYCRAGVDYNSTATITNSGYYYVSIEFIGYFESGHSGLTLLDPGQHSLKFRLSPGGDMHDEVIESLAPDGITLTSSANSEALDVVANFSVPNYDESSFKSIYKYMEDILKSTGGFLKWKGVVTVPTDKGDPWLEYDLFEAPSTSNEITDTDIIKGSFSANIEYKDLVYQFVTYNPHCTNEDYDALSSVSETNDFVKEVHGVTRTERFRHVLEDITQTIDTIAALRMNRLVTYNLTTKTKNLDSILGDEIQLTKDGLLGSDASKDLVIIGLRKMPDKTIIEATDLEGL